MTQVVKPSNIEDQVLSFMRQAGQLGEIGYPHFYSDLRQNRWEMLMGTHGEIMEYMVAEARDDLVEAVDGLIDSMWVMMGTLLTYVGADCARDLMNEVARANLSKVDGSLAPLELNDKGKVVKPEAWEPPDIEGILNRHGWKLNENGTPISD
jgi:hypothetical protein